MTCSQLHDAPIPGVRAMGRRMCGGEVHECEDGSTLCAICDADEIADAELEKCPGCGLLVEMIRHESSGYANGIGDCTWVECPACDYRSDPE